MEYRLESLLMSRRVRRYIECVIIVLCPWGLLTELPAKTMEGWGEEYDPEL